MLPILTLHGSTLTGASFASPQKFERPPTCNDLSYGIKIWRRSHLQWHDVCPEFQEKLPVASKIY
jgi:hypothetical protein